MENHTIVSVIPFNVDKKLIEEMIPFFELVEDDEENNHIQTSHMTVEAMDAIYKTLQDKKWDSCYLEIFSFFEGSQNQYLPLDFENKIEKTLVNFNKRGSVQPIDFNEFIKNLQIDYENTECKDEERIYIGFPPLIFTEKNINQILDYFSRYGIHTRLDLWYFNKNKLYQLDGIYIQFDCRTNKRRINSK